MIRRRVLAVVVAAALPLSACSGGSNSVDPTAGGNYRYVGVTPKGRTIAAAQRKIAGDATATYLTGNKKFSLDALRGQVVVLNYWANWCGGCVTETAGLERTYAATKASGVSFVGVAVKSDSKSAATLFVKNHGVHYPIVWDEIAKTALELGRVPTFTLPSTVVIDRQGRVAAVYTGIVQEGDLLPVLKTLAREK